MIAEELKARIPSGEIKFSTSRSSGPGGQNVNKVNTKVEARLNVVESFFLTQKEKERILSSLKNKINSDGELIVVSQSERTQFLNRKRAEEKLIKIMVAALTVKTPRRASSPTKASETKRLEKKKIHGAIKKLRQDTGFEEE
jgi:ribosome-associated protein